MHTVSIDKSQGVQVMPHPLLVRVSVTLTLTLTLTLNPNPNLPDQVILNEASLGAEILTAKCSELNVIVPGSEFEGGKHT